MDKHWFKFVLGYDRGTTKKEYKASERFLRSARNVTEQQIDLDYIREKFTKLMCFGYTVS